MDSMVQTGHVLASIPDKTIVMTGAVQSLPAGVYIAMNGRIWDPPKVRK